MLLDDVTGASAEQLVPTGPGDLVQQLNQAAGRFPVALWVAVGLVILGLLTAPFGLILLVVGIPVVWWLHQRDQARRSVVVFYDVNDGAAGWFDAIVQATVGVAGAQMCWRINAQGAVVTTQQRKTNAGASSVNKRSPAKAGIDSPKHLVTNVAVPTLVSGSASVHFLPDRILVRDGKRFSDVSYDAARSRAYPTSFIESERVPRDAQQVGTTWKFANIQGGPDRRYKNNRQLPVMAYGRLELSSSTGLSWILDCSQPAATARLQSIMTVTPNGPVPSIVAPIRRQQDLAEAEGRRRPELDRRGDHLRAAEGSGAPSSFGALLPERAAEQGLVRQARPRLGRHTGVRRLMLSRKRSAYPATEQVFTTIDLETTGLDNATDRIVEIGMVKFRGDGQVVDEFATLVASPGSSREAQEVHKIRDEDLVGAPSLKQVFPELLAFLDGTIMVAHNLDFEESFLLAASKRHQVSLPDLPVLCTLQTSRRQLDGHAFSLKAMYKTASGQWAADQHSALGDARSTMQVLLWLLRTAPSPLYLTGNPTSTFTGSQEVLPCPILPRPVPLMKASVAELLASFPQSTTPRAGNPAAIAQYTTLLELSLNDGRLTFDEAEALTKQARLTGITGTQLRDLHHQGWLATFPEDAHVDWATISSVRRREMFLLAEALGLSLVAERLGALIEAAADPPPGPEARYLRGTRFAFTGDSASLVALRERAVGHGASVAVNITKTVQWLATTTPECDDRKHTKAVELDIPVLTVSEASVRLEEAIRSASLEAFERQRQYDEWAARERQYAAERDAYWRPRWRSTELDRDPVIG